MAVRGVGSLFADDDVRFPENRFALLALRFDKIRPEVDCLAGMHPPSECVRPDTLIGLTAHLSKRLF